MTKPRSFILADWRCLVLFVSLCASATRAAPLAWWRFEDHPAGCKLDAETGSTTPPFTTTRDTIDARNALRTFNTRDDRVPPDTSPSFIHARVMTLAGGVPNERSARFVGNQDLYTLSEPRGPIDSAVLATFTIEGLFKLDVLSERIDNRYQVIIAKDGKPADALPFQPLAVVVAGRDDQYMKRDCLSVNLIDQSGAYHVAASHVKLEAGRWYAFAAVCDGKTLALHVNRLDGKGYQEEARTAVSGGLIDSVGTWTVGRGMFDRGPNSWLQGEADELRIDDGVRSPDTWLMHGQNNAPAAPAAAVAQTPPRLCIRDVADPAVLFDGERYYLYGTGDTRGFDVFVSRDLKSWEKLGRALEAGPGVWGDSHFWAPGVVQKNGKTYLFYSSSGILPDSGGRRSTRVCVAVASSPAGPFKEVVARLPLIGRAVIDPDVLIDADGQAYLYFVADVSESLGGAGQIMGVRLADDLLTTQGEPAPCIEASQPWEGATWNEGPAVFRSGDRYVMMYSGEGWFSPDYAIGYATARSPLGPWRKADENPIARRLGGLLGTGHNSVVMNAPGGPLIFLHAHRGPGDVRRDTYVTRMEIDKDERGRPRVRVMDWE